MKIYITKDSNGEIDLFTEKPKRMITENGYVYYCATNNKPFINEELFKFLKGGDYIEGEIIINEN